MLDIRYTNGNVYISGINLPLFIHGKESTAASVYGLLCTKSRYWYVKIQNRRQRMDKQSSFISLDHIVVRTVRIIISFT